MEEDHDTTYQSEDVSPMSEADNELIQSETEEEIVETDGTYKFYIYIFLVMLLPRL